MTSYRTFAVLADQTFCAVARTKTQTARFNGVVYHPDADGVVRVFGSGPIELEGSTFWDLVTIIDGEWFGPPFSGDTVGGTWLGDPHDSESRYGRSAALFRITDDVTTDYETFTCVAHTKSMSLENPHKYKRLFWWGLDGIFRSTLTATAVPIVYGARVTWGDIRRKGMTWGQLLTGTWGKPTTEPISVETVLPELGTSAQRKFAKFNKGLRFRQIQFQIVFDTYGNLDTAPVRLFSLHAEVNPAQTVSKSIS